LIDGKFIDNSWVPLFDVKDVDIPGIADYLDPLMEKVRLFVVVMIMILLFIISILVYQIVSNYEEIIALLKLDKRQWKKVLTWYRGVMITFVIVSVVFLVVASMKGIL